MKSTLYLDLSSTISWSSLIAIILIVPYCALGQHEKAIDSSFAVNGFLEVEEGGFFIDDQKRIVNYSLSDSLMAVDRYDENGSVDLSWGVNGRKTFSWPYGYKIQKLIGQANRGFILLGINADKNRVSFKLDADLNLEDNFGIRGLLEFEEDFSWHTTEFKGNSYAIKRRVQSDTIEIVKFDNQGTIDQSFGEDGIQCDYLDRDGNIVDIIVTDSDWVVIEKVFPIRGVMNAHGNGTAVFDMSKKLGGAGCFPYSRSTLGVGNEKIIIPYDQYAGHDYSAKLAYIDIDGFHEFPDNSEASNFTFFEEISRTFISSVVEPVDGPIICLGNYYENRGASSRVYLKAISGDGGLDKTFGDDGHLIMQLMEEPGFTRPGQMILTPDKKIYFSLQVKDIYGNNEVNYIVRLDEGLISSSRSVLENGMLNLSPNPSSSEFILKEEPESVRVYTMSGRELPVSLEGRTVRLLEAFQGQVVVRVTDRDGFVRSAIVLLTSR